VRVCSTKFLRRLRVGKTLTSLILWKIDCMNRFLPLSVILIFLLLFCTGDLYSEEVKTIKSPFNPNNALNLLYGGNTFSDASLSKYFHGQSIGYISLAFKSSYIENGQEKHIVISHITPEPADEYVCHACYPLIGGAVFSKAGGGWKMESGSKIIGWGGSFQEEMNLVKIGPDRYGVKLLVEDDSQGYETKLIWLILPHNTELSEALEVGFGEKPGPGACGKRAQKQTVELEMVNAEGSEYFDVISHVKRNNGSCKKLSAQRETNRYRFISGKYKCIDQRIR
jgi:hypothetical protein